MVSGAEQDAVELAEHVEEAVVLQRLAAAEGDGLDAVGGAVADEGDDLVQRSSGCRRRGGCGCSRTSTPWRSGWSARWRSIPKA